MLGHHVAALVEELEGGLLYSKDGTRITDRFNAGGDSFRGFARARCTSRDGTASDHRTPCQRPDQRRAPRARPAS